MADDPIAKRMLAERAYGPIYSSQYANAMKSSQVNELARKWDMPHDIVEATMPDLLAADRVKKRMGEAHRNQAYARVMSSPRFAAAAIDDDKVPQVAQRTQEHVDFLSPTWFGMQTVGAAKRAHGLASRLLYGTSATIYQALGMQGVAKQVRGLRDQQLSYADTSEIDRRGTASWEDVKRNPLNAPRFGIEQMIRSAPDMVGTLALPAYIAARADELGQQRAESNGTEQGLGDTLTAAPYAAASAFLERIGFKGITAGIKNATGKAIMGAATREAGTEFVQSGIEYTGTNAGTAAGFDVNEAVDQMIAGAVGGFFGGGIVTGAGAGVKRAIETKVDRQAALHVDRLMEAAGESATRTANPSDFEEALNQLVGDTAAENLYIPAEQVQALFEAGEDGRAPDIKDDPFWSQYEAQVREALAIGGDVVIPLAKAATNIAGTPQWDALKDHVRVSAKGVSITEAKEREKPENLEKMAQQIASEINDAVPRMQYAQAVAAVKNFASGLGYQGEQADLISRYVANAVTTRYAEAKASGEFKGTVQEFAAQWLPQVQKMAQASYERGGAGSTLEQDSRPIVYHGTTAEFDRFDNSKTKFEQDRGAIFFTDKRGIAEGYSTEGEGPSSRVIAARLKIDNPLKLSAGSGLSALEEWDYSDGKIAARAKDEGYDGVIITSEDDTLYVAFDPNQIENVNEQEATGGQPSAAGELRDRGGLAGSDGTLAQQPGSDFVDDRPIEGSPQELTVPGRGKVVVRATRAARAAAQRYMRIAGLAYAPAMRYAKVDEGRAKRLADAFEAMKHDPNDPLVAAAYQAMIAETLAQFQEIKATGLDIEFIREGQEDPYAASPRLAILDVQENNHLWVYPTQLGFGDGTPRETPMLNPTGEFIDGHALVVNDVFRIVHDYFGHVKDGHGFRAEGEENAWQSHAAMYSPLARRAMTTETRGQNSWVNYGPHAQKNKAASGSETVYAEQKVGLLPEWASEEGMLAAPWSGTREFDYDQEARAFREGRPVYDQDGTQGFTGPGELDRPPVDADGNIRVQHFSAAEGVTETDPNRWGQGKAFYTREERSYIAKAPPRTYFGIATNRPGGYKLEFQGRKAYGAAIPAERMYDVGSDPDGLWVRGYPDEGEWAIKRAGYAGYWHKNPQLGMVAVVFEPVQVERIEPSNIELTLAQTAVAPGFERAAPWLTDEEKQGMREASQRKLMEALSQLPDPEEAAAVAIAGRAKKGWYARAAQAIVDVFGLNDAHRFAALLAATSPQLSVEMNLYNALSIWKNWIAAGRPTDRREIVEIMGQSVAGDKGVGSVLNAWINNAVSALSTKDASSIRLSGPKVDSFMFNLVGVVEEVTNDTWMARYAGVDQSFVRSINGGKGPGYKAMNAVMRQAAAIATERTGQSWEPMEVQETIWSFAKTLYEMAQRDPEGRLTTELLDAAELTHSDVADTVDFATLFSDGIFRTLLEEAGYGEQVANLEGDGRDVRRDGDRGSVTDAEGTGFAPDDFNGFLQQAASRLGRELELRRAKRDARQGELTLNQSVSPTEEVFYSNAQRAVENAKQEKASADQWIALLTPGRTPGIKAEEIEWTGIIDWLKMQKGQIEKGALLQVLRDRGVQVEEVVLGDAGANWKNRDRDIERMMNDMGWDRQRAEDEYENDPAQRQDFIEEGQEPQFQSWSSDPSNETYRELLITLPVGQGSNPERTEPTHWDTEGVVAHVRFMEKADAEGKRVLFIEEVQSDWHQHGRDQGYEVDQSKRRAELNEAVERAIEERKEAGRALIEAARPLYKDTLEWIIRSPDTTTDEKNTAQLNLQGLNGLISPDGMIRNLRVWSTERAEEIRKNELAAYQAAQLRENEANQAFRNTLDVLGVPNAPFKTSWPALVMKRAIRWAVDNGFERVAWTTGEEQASRYNLSQATGPIKIQRLRDGKFGEYAVLVNSSAADTLARNGIGHRPPEAMSIKGEMLEMSADELKQAFGADIANRLIDGVEAIDMKAGEQEYRDLVRKKNELTEATSAAAKAGDDEKARALQTELNEVTRQRLAKQTYWQFELDGEGLNVGGEGMKAFYDRNLVNITNDIIKKYGAKVGKVELVKKEKVKRTITIADEGISRREDRTPILATNPGFDITPQLAEAAGSGFALFQQKRGNISIRPGPDGMMQSALIRAFESANFSTAIHELGHFFLEDLKGRALRSGGTPQAQADWNTFKQWASEIASGPPRAGSTAQDWAAFVEWANAPNKDSLPVPVEAHEYFARGMERFVWEGNAPSRGLRAIFTQMRDFMLDLYKTATAFNAPITPEIRDVMARLLASQEEIDAQHAELTANRESIKGLLTETETAAYDALTEESRQDARDKLYSKILSALRSEKLSEFREQKTRIKAEVASEIDQQPVYQALRILRVGIPDESGAHIKARLPRQWLIDNYGDDIEGQLPKGVPPIVSDTDYADPEMVAEMSGFDSADAMIKRLVELETERVEMKAEGDTRSPRMRALEDESSNRIRDEIGDPLVDLEEEAQAALQNDRQAELMSMELRALARKSGRKPTPWRLAVEWARGRVRGSSTKDASTGTAIQMYARNAAKAQKAAEEALVKGDFEEAFQAKQQQLLNSALMQEAKRARDEVNAAVKRMRKLVDKPFKSIDPGYIDQVHTLLEDVDLKNRTSTDVTKREAFSKWHATQTAQGIEPIVPVSYREALGQTHWTKLAVDELLELDKLVQQIVELGRLKKLLKDGKAARDFDEAVAEMQDTALNQPGRAASKTTDEARNLPARIRSSLRSVDAAMLKVEQMMLWLDGDNPNGPWTRMIFNVMAEAGGREQDLLRAYVEEINGLIKALPKKVVQGWTRSVDTPELVIRNPEHTSAGQPFQGTKDQVVMMAMNWGNDGNRQRLVDGFGWREVEVEQVFARILTKEDWDFVQSVWDTVDKLWPDVAALEQRVNGLAPEKVESVPIATQHGVYRGGYFPAVYDPTQSTRSATFEDDKLSPQGGLMQVVTRSSATKARSVAVKGRPLLLDMSVITRHLGEVIHDVTHREAVGQVRKLLTEPRVASAIRNRLGPEYAKAMGGWLENIATPNVSFNKDAAALVGIGRHLNKGVSLVGLGFRFTTTIMQLLGIPSIVGEIGSKHMMRGIGIAIANPVQAHREIVARSAEMRSRWDTLDASMEDMVSQAQGGAIQTIGAKGMVKYAFHGILYMDMVVTTAGWTGAFNKALEQGMGEDEATLFADKVIRTTQGAGSMKDRSSILNAHPIVRSLYPFFSYLNALYNMQRDVARRYRHGEVAEATRRMWWVAIVPMLLQSLIFGEGPEPDDDDEKPDGADWAQYLVKSIMLGNLGSIPGLGPIANALGSGYGYRSNAYQQIGEGIIKGYEKGVKIVTEDEDLSGATVKSVLTTVGILAAKPLGQIGATTQGVYDYARGEAEPEDAGDWYELLTKGRISKEPTAAEQLMGEASTD